MKLDLFKYTDIGSRDENEDYACIRKNEQGYTAILCDGLGGCNKGEVASELAAENLQNGIETLSQITKAGIEYVVNVVNSELVKYQKDHPECRGMNTTAVGCIIRGDELNYFNVGDSRFYFFKNGSLKCISMDHSVSQLSFKMGQITFADIRNDVNRSRLLKSLGTPNQSRELASVYPSIKVEAGDAFLLCSDGFWEYVLEEEMEVDLSKSNNANEWVNYMRVRLLLRKNDNNDNNTVIAGIVSDEETSKLNAGHLVNKEDILDWSKQNEADNDMLQKTQIQPIEEELSENYRANYRANYGTNYGTNSKTEYIFNTTYASQRPTHSEKTTAASRELRKREKSISERSHNNSGRAKYNKRYRKRQRKAKRIMGIEMTHSNKVITACIVIALLLVIIIVGIVGLRGKGKVMPAGTENQTTAGQESNSYNDNVTSAMNDGGTDGN